MNAPIQLSLLGDRRLVILTPQTVKRAYFQFVSANRAYGSWQKYRLQTPLYERQDLTILDALYRFPKVPLHDRDIQKIEKEINSQILKHDLALIEGEYRDRLHKGELRVHQAGKNREKVQYLIRYGLIFVLEATVKSKMLSMRNTDLFWQDYHYEFHYVRYCGLLSSSRRDRIELLFRKRLDLARSWTCTLEEFKPRQLFKISAIYPCEGFILKT